MHSVEVILTMLVMFGYVYFFALHIYVIFLVYSTDLIMLFSFLFGFVSLGAYNVQHSCLFMLLIFFCVWNSVHLSSTGTTKLFTGAMLHCFSWLE